MLFLYRPRQTWMPFAAPRPPTEQAAYNRELQARFDSTRRVTSTPAPARDEIDALRQLGALHAAGVLTDDEFAAAKARIVGR